MLAPMDASQPEPEQLEREFPGWVAWTSVSRFWYARWLKSPDVTLRADSGEELRRKISEWRAQNVGET
jgi:hypothetical protein